MGMAEPVRGTTSPAVPGATACRHCGAPLELTMVDLGKSPLCQTVLTTEELERGEVFYPAPRARLRTAAGSPRSRSSSGLTRSSREYAYFSAYSDSWVEHARRYADQMVERLALGPESLVVELASNDGYLLQHFLPHGIPVLGIEPARNVAEAAIARGIPTLTEFFGAELGHRLVAERGHADLVLGQQRARAGSRHQRLRRGCQGAACAEGHGDVRVPAPRDAARASRVRHDLPRALLVLLAHSIRRSSARTGSRSSTSRSCRPTEARCASFSRHADDARPTRRPSLRSSRGRTPRASATRRRTARFARGVASRSARCSTFLIELAATGSTSSATALRARETRCSTTAASGRTFSTTRSTETRTSRGSTCPGRRSRSIRPRRSRRRGRSDPHPPVEPRGRDQRAARVHGGWGAQLVVPIPSATVFAPETLLADPGVGT